jgi:hypothetical protein
MALFFGCFDYKDTVLQKTITGIVLRNKRMSSCKKYALIDAFAIKHHLALLPVKVRNKYPIHVPICTATTSEAQSPAALGNEIQLVTAPP